MSQPYPTSIETARLVLRQPRPSDTTAMFAAYAQDEEVARYMVWRPHAALDETREFVAKCIDGWNSGTALAYVLALKDEGRVVGMLGAQLKAHIATLGYLLAREQWGKGLMPEAIRSFAQLALARDDVFRVEATCDVDNIPSARVLEKSGFVREGRLSRHTIHPNISAEPRPCFLYAACR